MTMTPNQQARVLEIQASFASIKGNLTALLAQARTAGDAPGVNAAYASLGEVISAHAACSSRLMIYDAAFGGGVVVSGPAR
jgi:hypothetical protein